MLTYKNKVLSYNNTPIVSNDTTLILTSDIDVDILGVLKFKDSSYKTIPFIKDKGLYKGRLLLEDLNLNQLSDSQFYLTISSPQLSGSTNTINLNFNLLKIKQSIKVAATNDIRELQIDIQKIKGLVQKVVSNIPAIKVKDLKYDGELIEPGMIPVAIDETGRCIFQYPFIDHVTEINGQKTLNNAILLTAKDIPIEQTDVESAIKAHTEAIKELNSYLNTLSSSLKQVTNKVATIEQQLLQHTDSSII